MLNYNYGTCQAAWWNDSSTLHPWATSLLLWAFCFCTRPPADFYSSNNLMEWCEGEGKMTRKAKVQKQKVSLTHSFKISQELNRATNKELPKPANIFFFNMRSVQERKKIRQSTLTTMINDTLDPPKPCAQQLYSVSSLERWSEVSHTLQHSVHLAVLLWQSITRSGSASSWRNSLPRCCK